MELKQILRKDFAMLQNLLIELYGIETRFSASRGTAPSLLIELYGIETS